MFRHLLLAGALLLLPIMAWAASEAEPAKNLASQPLTLVQALAMTRQYHPALKAVEAELAVLDNRASLAGMSPPISIGLEVENFAGSDEQEGFDGAELTLSLSSVLELGGKPEARKTLAMSQNAQRGIELEQQRRDILTDTAQRFIEVTIAEAEVAQAKSALELSVNTRKASQRRADAGAAPATELRRAWLREQDAELSLSMARKLLQSVRRALALSMGREGMMPEVQANPLELPELIALPELLENLGQVAAVQSADASLRITEAEMRLAQAAARPDLELSGGVRHSEQSGNQALVVGFSMPLGTRRRSEPARLLAAGQQAAAEQVRQAATLRVQAIVTQAWYRLAAYRNELETLTGELQAEADAVVAETEKGYRSGRFSLLELNAAQADALGIARRSLQAAAGFHRTLIEIERLVGDRAVKESES